LFSPPPPPPPQKKLLFSTGGHRGHAAAVKCITSPLIERECKHGVRFKQLLLVSFARLKPRSETHAGAYLTEECVGLKRPLGGLSTPPSDNGDTLNQPSVTRPGCEQPDSSLSSREDDRSQQCIRPLLRN